MTIKELLTEHPEYLNLTMVVYRQDGAYEYVGEDASVYVGKEMKDIEGKDCEPTGRELLVFSCN